MNVGTMNGFHSEIVYPNQKDHSLPENAAHDKAILGRLLLRCSTSMMLAYEGQLGRLPLMFIPTSSGIDLRAEVK